jgi:AcrR family transcriptional regulator
VVRVGESSVRRRPQQQRSLERFERVLAAAAGLIAETGIESVRMSEIAERAGVPIGSVYQYFPDKLAIVRTLADQVLDRVHQQLVDTYADVTTKAEFLDRTDTLVQEYYTLITEDPVARHILMAMQSDRDLQQLDIDDSRRNAEVVLQAGRRFVSPGSRDEFTTLCVLVMHLTGSAVRLAVAVSRPEGDRLMHAHRRVVRAQLDEALDRP